MSDDAGAAPHLVTFVSGDIVAEPQTLNGTVAGGKADLSGPLKATYNFEKWIKNTNQGDSSVYGAVVHSFITVVVDVGGDQYTIKLYTCVDHRKTTVTETSTNLLVSQTEGTSCAYKVPLCAWSNEGEDPVFQGISECSLRQSSETLVAASPMISMSFTSERTSMRSLSKYSR